jgi:hypothetical protein
MSNKWDIPGWGAPREIARLALWPMPNAPEEACQLVRSWRSSD